MRDHWCIADERRDEREELNETHLRYDLVDRRITPLGELVHALEHVLDTGEDGRERVGFGLVWRHGVGDVKWSGRGTTMIDDRWVILQAPKSGGWRVIPTPSFSTIILPRSHLCSVKANNGQPCSARCAHCVCSACFDSQILLCIVRHVCVTCVIAGERVVVTRMR